MAGAAASFSGVQTCHSVHLCPVCMSKVLAVRASNVQLAADGLAAAGYVLALGTNTLRHFPRQAYGSLRRGQRGGLVAVLHDAWKGAYGSAGRPWRRLRDSYGIVGYERAFEDTWGSQSGFHLHWHVLWVLKVDPALTGDQRRELLDGFRRSIAATWRDAVLGAGGYEVSMKCDRPDCSCGGEGHGTDVRFIGADEEGDAARYLYKDGDKGSTIGLELTGAAFKDGRAWDRMSPLQLGDLAAEELLQLGEPGPLTEKYRERERGVFNVHKHYRSQSLNRLIKSLEIEQDVRTEAEIASEEGEGLRAVAVIPARTWYRHIAYHPGRRLALLKATEALGETGVRTLIESWGLVWGRDVLPAPAEDESDPTEEAPAPVADDAARRQDDERQRAKLDTVNVEREAFLAARRVANAARKDEIDAAMARVRATA